MITRRNAFIETEAGQDVSRHVRRFVHEEAGKLNITEDQMAWVEKLVS